MAERTHRSLRSLGVVLLVVVLAAASVTLGLVLVGRSTQRTAAGTPTATATATVVRTDLANTIQLAGTLGYAGSYAMVNRSSGSAITWLPQAGSVVGRGHRLYEVDGRPSVLLLGSRPAWRPLSYGVPAGADVRQLEQNLVVLGYANPVVLKVGDQFTLATRAAVKRWQRALGLTQTGVVALGDVVFSPVPLRVTTVAVPLGSRPSPGGTVLTGTSTAQLVLASVSVGQQNLLRPGQPVTVTLPDGHTMVPARVTSVSSVATVAPQDGGGRATPDQSGPGGTAATVEVGVRLTGAPAPGGVDQAPVSVNVVSAEAKGVLAVPINALVAVSGGGYGVEVRRGGVGQVVAVTTGLFTGALVQVTGDLIRAGDTVTVPAS